MILCKLIRSQLPNSKILFCEELIAMRISSRGKSEDDFILRLTLIISNMPFYYKRVQFPMLHLSFAMSIDKCQDQTSKAAGLQ